MQKKSKNKRLITELIIFLLCIPAALAAGIFLFQDKQYYLICAVIMILSLIPFFMLFEKRKPGTRELVTVAVMVALAVAGRAIGFMFPQVKLLAAVVILSAAAFGGEVGFLTGALSAFLSNFFFGQGGWTPFQMMGLGLTGFIMGMLFYNRKFKYKSILLPIAGGLLTFAVYGFIVDLNSALMFSADYTFQSMLPVFLSGASFNGIFGVTTAVVLLIFNVPVLEKLERIKLKYGLFDE